MIIWEYEIYGKSRSDKFYLIPLGDTHVGIRAFDRKKFLEHVNWIKKTPNTFWVGVGDYTESIIPKDIRFDPDIIDPRYTQEPIPKELRNVLAGPGATGFRALRELPKVQAEDFIGMVKGIADKCIGLSMGNHEWDIKDKYGFDALGHLCQELGVKNLGWNSMTRLRFSIPKWVRHSAVLVMQISHGSTAGRKKGGKVNRLEDRTSMFEADIYIGGHSHDRIATTRHLLALSKRGKLRFLAKKQVFVIVPSFFQTYEEGITTYAERKEYPPTSTGLVKIIIEPFRKDEVNMHVSQ